MYREKELLGKEVIGSGGGLLGRVLKVTVQDDVPCIVVGRKGFLVSEATALKADDTVVIPYYNIETVHDTIILKITMEEAYEEKRKLE
jgi:sporulation protein YlmC with PRC-barrel domain